LSDDDLDILNVEPDDYIVIYPSPVNGLDGIPPQCIANENATFNFGLLDCPYNSSVRYFFT